MNTGMLHTGPRKMRVVKGLLLQAATAALVAAAVVAADTEIGGNAPRRRLLRPPR